MKTIKPSNTCNRSPRAVVRGLHISQKCWAMNVRTNEFYNFAELNEYLLTSLSGSHGAN